MKSGANRRMSASCLACCAAAQAKTRQIQIGTFMFLGTSDPNCGSFCNAGYEVFINASAITGDVLSFGNILVAIGTVSQDSGVETTPIDLVFVGGAPPFVLPDCARWPVGRLTCSWSPSRESPLA